ncbi:MAG: hypothetical protein H6Q89_3957, partial [Myxococcaceae bacterium]|nr:hypothetical protein [Myxococcaceae bacterium]
MTRRSVRFHEFVAVTLGLTLALSCGGTGSACSCLTPLPQGRYTGPKTDNAINLRISPNGVNYLNSNWQKLVAMFAPGNMMSLPIPCAKQTISVLGDVYIADQGGTNGGRLDAKCDTKDAPANVTVKITGFQLVPTAPDKVAA